MFGEVVHDLNYLVYVSSILFISLTFSCIKINEII